MFLVNSNTTLTGSSGSQAKGMQVMATRTCLCFALLVSVSLTHAESESNNSAPTERSAYFGDLHIHTMYSFDAFTGNVRTTPDDAYRYAKGEPIGHPSGETLRLYGPPLDFLAVSEHAMYLGVFAAQLDAGSPTYGHPDAETLLPRSGIGLDRVFVQLSKLKPVEGGLLDPEMTRYAWAKVVDAAERHNEPGKFTAFIGYEYTPTPGSRHLHRNVIFRSNQVPGKPFSSLDSADPEHLWNWLDDLRAEGIESLAIPHNMNQSDGLAFQETTFQGEPIDQAYAEKRMRNEPIAEISQIKGTSETHPSLSPNDEWADFQIVRYYLDRARNTNPISVFKGGYYRDALKTGISFQDRSGFNPYQLGVIGSSDSHVSAGPYDENRYFTGGANNPRTRGSAYPATQDSWQDFWTPRQATHGTGGLAGVWAEDNTRTSLFDAMRRRETFATSGPRILLRFFGSFDFSESIVDAPDLVRKAYADGASMGTVMSRQAANGDIEAHADAPGFVLWAARDPRSNWLQRIQIVKGWVHNGQSQEAVYDVACADGLSPDRVTHRCPDNGAQVNLDDCSVSRNKGAVELKAFWQDPDFDPQAQSFYYARVLENPSCRWSTLDAIRLGIAPNPDLAAIHQERAWSSPIWYEP